MIFYGDMEACKVSIGANEGRGSKYVEDKEG